MPYKDPGAQAVYMRQHRKDKPHLYAAAQKRWRSRKRRAQNKIVWEYSADRGGH